MIKKLTSIAVLASMSIFATPAMADGIDANTVFLMHCEDFTDASDSNHTITPNSVLISSSFSQFGGSSCSFDGNNDQLISATSTDWQFDAGDFTLDFWLHPTNISGFRYLINTYSDGDGGWGLLTNGSKLRFFWSTNGSYQPENLQETAGNVLTTNVWQHIAVFRDGNDVHLAIDGVITDTFDMTGVTIHPTGRQLEIGRATHSAGSFFGYMDEIRISKGVSRWTGNFTPATAAYSSASPANVTAAASDAIASTSVPAAISSLTYVSNLVGEAEEELSTDSLDAAKASNGVKDALRSMNDANEDLSDIQTMIDFMFGLSTAGLDYPNTLKAMRAWRLQ